MNKNKMVNPKDIPNISDRVYWIDKHSKNIKMGTVEDVDVYNHIYVIEDDKEQSEIGIYALISFPVNIVIDKSSA